MKIYIIKSIDGRFLCKSLNSENTYILKSEDRVLNLVASTDLSLIGDILESFGRFFYGANVEELSVDDQEKFLYKKLLAQNKGVAGK